VGALTPIPVISFLPLSLSCLEGAGLMNQEKKATPVVERILTIPNNCSIGQKSAKYRPASAFNAGVLFRMTVWQYGRLTAPRGMRSQNQ
jgi:hypothetical protein